MARVDHRTKEVRLTVVDCLGARGGQYCIYRAILYHLRFVYCLSIYTPRVINGMRWNTRTIEMQPKVETFRGKCGI